MYGNGIGKSGEIFDLGVQLSLVDNGNIGYFYKGSPLGSGKREAVHMPRSPTGRGLRARTGPSPDAIPGPS